MLGLAAFFVMTLVFCAKALEPARSGRARIARRWIGTIGTAALGSAVVLIASAAPEKVDLSIWGTLVATLFVSLSAFIGSFRKLRPEKL